MTASWHVVAKLITVSRMSKVDYQNKVLPNIFIYVYIYVYNLFIFLLNT